jgi:hypothetical protein
MPSNWLRGTHLHSVHWTTRTAVHHRTTCSTLDCIASRGTQTHWKTAMYTCCVLHMRQYTLRWSEMTDHHACNCVCSCAGPVSAVSHMMHWKSPMRSHQTQRTRRQCQVWSHHGWATPIGKALNAMQLATRYTSTLSTLNRTYTTAPLAVLSTA